MNMEEIYFDLINKNFKPFQPKLIKLYHKYKNYQKIYEYLKKRNNLFLDDKNKTSDEINKNGIKIITLKSKFYPKNFLKIPEKPLGFYVLGNLNLLNSKNCLYIAVVGTRKPTFYGLKIAQKISEELSKLGVIVISGLAYGIDSCAHKSVINSKGKTIAIIGEGIITALKSTKRKLIEEIIQNDGLVISEFSNETKAMPYHFPLRNRLIAALSDGVVIVEAPIDSGALITAKYALKYNKEIFVVPGEITNKNFEGSHNLIKQGAKLITKVEDILEEFNFKLPEKIIKTEKLTAEEEMVVEILNKKPMTIEEISRNSKKSIEDLLVILTYMEIKGLVKNYNGKFYVTQLN